MTRPQAHYAGRDLGPLAFESETSVLLRIAWRNAFTLLTMRTHFSRQKTKFALDPERLLEHYGWIMPVHVAQPRDADRIGVYLAWTFRYCPLCMECGYHSYLHQCLELVKCPVHDVVLSAHCHCCAAPTPPVIAYAALFDKPYYCERCRQPICGVAPSLEAHLDLRSAFGSVQQRLLPYDQWWESGDARRTRAVGMANLQRVGYQFIWCDKPEFVRSLSGGGNEQLDCLRSPLYDHSNVTTLQWRQRIPLGNIDEYFRQRADWKTRVGIPTAVYRCTLRLLKKWMDTDVATAMRVEAATLVPPNLPCMREYGRRKQALALMRAQLESDCSWTSNLPNHRAMLSDCPKVDMATHNDRTSRLGWRAVFLAIFATWYELAGGSPQKLKDAAKQRQGDAALIFFGSRAWTRMGEQWSDWPKFNPDEAWFSGSVAFPRIAGMPTNPWKAEGRAARPDRDPGRVPGTRMFPSG